MTILQFVLLGAALFSIGLYGVLTRKNAVLVLASVELMLAAVNVNLVVFDVHLQDTLHAGQIFSLFIIALAAAEVGIGIAIVLMAITLDRLSQALARKDGLPNEFANLDEYRAAFAELGVASVSKPELEADDIPTRVVSLPCWERFDAQSQESILKD